MSVDLRESVEANGVRPAGTGSRSSPPSDFPCGAPSPQARAELRQRAPVWNLTIDQVAGFLQRSEKTIDRMVAAQEIGSTKIGRARMFPREEVCRAYAARFLAGRRLQPGEAVQIAERALDQFLAANGKSQMADGQSEEIADLRRRIELLETHFGLQGTAALPKEAA